MGIRYRKRIKILPGVNINISKSGISTTIGPKGCSVNIGKNGTYLNAGIPGTGIYSRERISRRKSQSSNVHKPSDSEIINSNPLGFVLCFVCFFLAVMLPLMTDASWWLFPIFVIVGILLIAVTSSKPKEKIPVTMSGDAQSYVAEINACLRVIDETLNVDTLNLKYRTIMEHMNHLENIGIKLNGLDIPEARKLVDKEYNERLNYIRNSDIYNSNQTRMSQEVNFQKHEKIETQEQVFPQKLLSDFQKESLIEYYAKNRAGYILEDLEEVDMGRLDPLFEDAARLIVIHQQGSTSLIQRKFAIGYNRAGRIMDQLEKAGIVSEESGSKAREVFILCENDLELNLKLRSQSDISSIDNKVVQQFIIEHEAEIEEKSNYYKSLIQRKKEEQERAEVEYQKEILKQKILEKERKQKIQQIALKELEEEGFLVNSSEKKVTKQRTKNLQEQQYVEATEPPAQEKNDYPSIYEADESEVGDDSSLQLRFAEMNESGSIIRETTDIGCLVDRAQIVKEHLMWLQRNGLSVNSASPVIIMKSVLYMDCNDSILRIARLIIDKYKSQYQVADNSEKENLTVNAFKEIDKCIYFVFGTMNKDKTLSELNVLRDMIEDTYSTL